MPAVTGPMVHNAKIIAAVGQQMGMSHRDIIIGLMASLTESNLINVHFGDSDSLGLFQQRPSQGWGTPEQIMNPAYAARRFFLALRALGGARNNMKMGQAAQAVQRSAFPGRYQTRMDEAHFIFQRMGGAGGVGQLPKTMGNQIFPGAVGQGPVQIVNPIGSIPLDEPLDDGQGDSWRKFSGDKGLGAVSFQNLGVRDLPGMKSMNQDTMMPSFAPQALPLGRDDFANLFGVVGTIKAPAAPGLPNMGGRMGGGAVSGWRNAVVQMARRQIGTPYVWGGTSPRGFDCSGLVQWVFEHVGPNGLNMPRISFEQAGIGHRRKLSNLVAGDLVAWNNSSRNPGADHIAIYVGHGMIIEAPQPGMSVRLRHISGDEGAFGVHLPF